MLMGEAFHTNHRVECKITLVVEMEDRVSAYLFIFIIIIHVSLLEPCTRWVNLHGLGWLKFVVGLRVGFGLKSCGLVSGSI